MDAISTREEHHEAAEAPGSSTLVATTLFPTVRRKPCRSWRVGNSSERS